MLGVDVNTNTLPHIKPSLHLIYRRPSLLITSGCPYEHLSQMFPIYNVKPDKRFQLWKELMCTSLSGAM